MTDLETRPAEPETGETLNHLICCTDINKTNRKTACGLPIPDDDEEIPSGDVDCVVCAEYTTTGNCPHTNKMCPVVWAHRSGYDPARIKPTPWGGNA